MKAGYQGCIRYVLASINDAGKKELYTICGHISSGICGLSDCHHNSYRFIEKWIHGIGTQAWKIEDRPEHRERQRLGKLIFGYSLALDSWLLEIPHQFLLMDLGYIDLGFDPSNEIKRVYAYLGDDRQPVKKWLAACLWYNVTLQPPASLYKWGWWHKEIVSCIESKGLSVRRWIDRQCALGSTP